MANEAEEENVSVRILMMRYEQQSAEMERLQSESLNGGGGGGTSGGMEARLAKLEAQMGYVQSELIKLASVPVDVATIKERLTHLPTKDEARITLESALDRAGAKTQRGVAISVGIGTLLISGVALLLKLYGG